MVFLNFRILFLSKLKMGKFISIFVYKFHMEMMAEFVTSVWQFEMSSYLINRYKQIINSFIMEKQQGLLDNWEAITSFLPYLSISDMLKSSLISKTWNYNLGQYFKKVILPEQSIHLDQNPFRALKIMYDRNIIFMNKGEINVRRFPFLVQAISIGKSVTYIKTVEGEHYIAANACLQMMNKEQLVKSPACRKLVRKNINEVKCVGDYVYCVRDYDIVQYKPNEEDILAGEILIEFQGVIDHFLASPAYTFTSCSYHNQQTFHIFPHNQPKPIEIKITLPIHNIPNDVILTHGAFAFIISQFSVFQCNLSQNPIKFTPVKMLKGKRISEIKVGKGHYLAFEMKKKAISQWQVTDVVSWADENGLADFKKIFKAEQVDGKKLTSLNKSYMEDTLGITGAKTQQKLKLLIDEALNIHSNPDNYQILGWGRNDRGQLGANPFNKATNTVKPKIPEDYYVWACVGDFTIIKKIHGEVYKINAIEENKQVWADLSDSRIWAIGATKQRELIFLGSLSKQKIPQRLSEQPITQEKKKMKTAKNVLDKILWDQKYKKENFQVGYMDRYQGMLQMQLSDFLKGEEREHRIYYFKENGKIVWDRNNRIDIL